MKKLYAMHPNEAPTNRNREDELSSVGDKHYDTQFKALQYNSMENKTV